MNALRHRRPPRGPPPRDIIAHTRTLATPGAAATAKKEFENPRYMELLIPHHYVHHILRLPPEQWPDPVNRAFKHINPAIYIPMQGPSELGLSGKLLNWNRTNELSQIAPPTLVIGARYDTMDPAHMERMAKKVQKGRYLFCRNGSHLALYDDQKVYVEGLIKFILDVDRGRFQFGR